MRGNSFSDVVNTAFGAWMPMPFSSIHCAKTWSADGYPRTNFGLNELTVWAWVWRASSLMSNDERFLTCLLYTSDAADDLLCVDLGGRRIIKKKTKYLVRLV